MKASNGLLIVAALFASAGAQAGGKGSWGYQGKQGPEHWGSLNPHWSACSSGERQSPVDITTTEDVDLAALEINYQAGGTRIVNNGHTLQVDYQDGSSMTVDGNRYALKQLHFHAPSENTINGRSFPMEVHLVHANDAGELAVIGVMFEHGDDNAVVKAVWDAAPVGKGNRSLPTALHAADLLPTLQDYYRFSGSLTTPPCSEGVTWLVMKQPVSASAGQVDTFTSLMGGPTNRPVQPLNDRVVKE